MKNNSTYLVKSSRKGTFFGLLKFHDETWATFEITAGKALAMLAYNEREKGEEITVRRTFCEFTEQPGGVEMHLKATQAANAQALQVTP